MAPTLVPVTACWVSAVPRHPLGMQQSLLQRQRWERGRPTPVKTNCPPDEHVYGALEKHFQEKFEIFNLDMKTGDTLKVKGKISEDADSFSINLGCKSSDLAFHFNPRFNESVIVCNSRCSSAWQAEHREDHLCFSRGSTIKIIVEMLSDKFRVKLPDGHEVEFPNRHSYSKISYMSVNGGFRVISFKLE